MSIAPRPRILAVGDLAAERADAASATASVGTTSMWWMSRIGLAPPAPFSRASTIERPGPDSNRVAGIPSRSRIP